MADINIWTIVLIAAFTGLGSGIGNPIGQHIYEKFIKHRVEKAASKAENLSEKIKTEVSKGVNGLKDVDSKILGKTKFNKCFTCDNEITDNRKMYCAECEEKFKNIRY